MQAAVDANDDRVPCSLRRRSDSSGTRFYKRGLERLLGIHALNRFFAPLRDDPPASNAAFWQRVYAMLEIEPHIDGIERLASLAPDKGMIIVANHARGLLDLFVAGYLIENVLGREMRVLGNQIIGQLIPELRQYYYFVDNMGARTEERRETNRRALGQATEFVRGGGIFVVTPAGQVASFRARSPEGSWRITDHEWYPTFARMALETEAAIVPVRMDGRNSTPWYVFRLFGATMGRIVNFREFLRSRGARLFIQVHEPILYAAYRDLSPAELSAEVRRRIYQRTQR
jgi:putative hemolysin